mmetsp:Transcript_14414/g.26561  ORF Transcript_14414/g.26561 Transcript_14414/m.26561 type:complete len:128 (-) Transcript_14414:61-444(-)
MACFSPSQMAEASDAQAAWRSRVHLALGECSEALKDLRIKLHTLQDAKAEGRAKLAQTSKDSFHADAPITSAAGPARNLSKQVPEERVMPEQQGHRWAGGSSYRQVQSRRPSAELAAIAWKQAHQVS